jgi:hypothetical protein
MAAIFRIPVNGVSFEAAGVFVVTLAMSLPLALKATPLWNAVR